LPLTQRWVAVQAFPHVPQLWMSVNRLAQLLEQRVRPVGQAAVEQLLETQWVFPGQTLLHDPQWFPSPVSSAQ
jgi:hypothetical protein